MQSRVPLRCVQLLGLEADIATVTRDGVQYCQLDGALKEIVVATAADVGKLPGTQYLCTDELIKGSL